MGITTQHLVKRIQGSRLEIPNIPERYVRRYKRRERLAADEAELRRRGFSTARGHVGERV